MDNLDNYHDDFAWFVIQTYSIREQKAKDLIHSNIINQKLGEHVKEILIPKRQVITVNKGIAKKQVNKVFPGYLMIHMRPLKSLIKTIVNSNYVVGFLGATKNDPKPLNTQEMQHMMQLSSIDSADKHYLNDFKVGDMVRIVEGPFTDFKGTIKHINNKKANCTINVYILGRGTPVELSFFQIEKES